MFAENMLRQVAPKIKCFAVTGPSQIFRRFQAVFTLNLGGGQMNIGNRDADSPIFDWGVSHFGHF
jgi:hypothetical protein